MISREIYFQKIRFSQSQPKSGDFSDISFEEVSNSSAQPESKNIPESTD